MKRVGALPNRLGRSCLIVALAALLAWVACAEGRSVTDLEVGDCIVMPPPEIVEFSQVDVVDCAEPHDGEVIAMFDLEGDEYPGEDAVFQQVKEGCPVGTGDYFSPTEETWNEDNLRQVTCILTTLYDLQVGDCINYPLERPTELANVERADCSQPHDAEVIDRFEMPGTSFPGHGAIADYALANCPAGTDHRMVPSREAWELGSQEITCLSEGEPVERATATPKTAPSPLTLPSPRPRDIPREGNALGSADAPVTVIAFTDFQ